MKAYQRMLAEMLVERRSVGIGQRLPSAADNPARAPPQFAYAQRRQLGANYAGQFFERSSDEGCAVSALFCKRPQRAQGGAQVVLGKLGKHRRHETIQSKIWTLCAREIYK
jgi:hypothetical protein